MSEAPSGAIPHFEPNKRYYDEVLTLWRVIHEQDGELRVLRERVLEAERAAAAFSFAPDQIVDFGEAELIDLAKRMQRHIWTIVDELRHRQCDIAPTLLAPRIAELQVALQAEKARAFRAESQVYDLESELRRLTTGLRPTG